MVIHIQGAVQTATMSEDVLAMTIGGAPGGTPGQSSDKKMTVGQIINEVRKEPGALLTEAGARSNRCYDSNIQMVKERVHSYQATNSADASQRAFQPGCQSEASATVPLISLHV